MTDAGRGTRRARRARGTSAAGRRPPRRSPAPTAAAARSRPTRTIAIVDGRERHVGAERPAREHERQRRRRPRPAEVAIAARGVELLAAALVVGAAAALDAAEVEPQARDAGTRERVEQRADHDAAHRAAVLRVRVAQHRRRHAARRRASRARPRARGRRRSVHVIVLDCRLTPTIPSWSSTNARTKASSRHAS